MTPPFRFHVFGLPHTQTTKAYEHCAFTANIRKFCIMLKSLGHHVTLYASEDNEAPCDELVTCITKQEQKRTCGVDGPETILRGSYTATAPHWTIFNQRCIEAARSRVLHTDFLAIIAGDLQDPIIEAFPYALPIEYAVGYTGISQHTKRAFASSAWMHTVYGKFYGAHGTRGRFYDRIIPHYIDPADFTYSAEKDDYFLFVGRCNGDKGVGIAAEVCHILGKRLIVAGQGPVVPESVDYRGLVGVKERAQLMSRAKALFVPSLYLEPFGMVAIEGLISGTPLITTDWGGLSEINDHFVTGFRCHTLNSFVEAARRIDEINPANCRRKGMTYSLENVQREYQEWFDDLYGLWGKGWSEIKEPSSPHRDSPQSSQ